MDIGVEVHGFGLCSWVADGAGWSRSGGIGGSILLLKICGGVETRWSHVRAEVERARKGKRNEKRE